MTAQEYLESNLRIGFTDHKFLDYASNPQTYRTKCRGYDVKVEVCTQPVQFNGYHVTCAVTSRVEIARNLPLNGFASHCHQDEAQAMERAVAAYCEEFDYTICRKENSWPYAVAVVTKFETVPQPKERNNRKASGMERK